MLQKELAKRDKAASASEVRGKKTSVFFLLSLEKEDTHFLATYRAGIWPMALRSRCKKELLLENSIE